MSIPNIDEHFIYSLFADYYYERELKEYGWDDIPTHETVQCLLKSFYERKIGRRLLAPKIVMLSFGNLTHDALQEQLVKLNYQVEPEALYQIQNITFHNHTDAVHETHTLEIKTCSALPHEILPHHFLQANAGLIMNKRDIGYVAYIHKSSGICRVFHHSPIIDSFNYLLLRAVRLSVHLRQNITPQPEPSWLCRFCEYLVECPTHGKAWHDRGGF
jgi:hypothetical protein